ncbi:MULTISPECIES: hypothetical protein [Chromobacterium]|uniref:Uncharacterized protein n=2 Tax=Chromobacterium TaxID=535 RepID=A0A2R4K2M2_CHRVL|nr:hypothetical protein [Chromobacterium violaceum]AVV48142.1 hypothetical protein [Chromobacterium violaceum]MCD0490832.1 hypothetical protein [Chromobacterium violaceum]QIY77686.1 hypothetical protein FOB43_00035 [Chromobacterium violaceum]QRO35466.1 hypothetical protein I6K04_22585 [Chromobacterium violaceum]QRQ19381.1 hypothetical protein I6K03_22625 [Chromobacterium violaceum]
MTILIKELSVRIEVVSRQVAPAAAASGGPRLADAERQRREWRQVLQRQRQLRRW